MVTNTDQNKRFFDLIAQAIQLVNQRKRSEVKIDNLNTYLQQFKENKDGNSIWQQEDGLKPFLQLRIEIPVNMSDLESFSKPHVGKIFYKNVKKLPNRRIFKVPEFYGKRYIAEIYQRVNNHSPYLMDEFHLALIAKYRNRDLLGEIGGTLLLAQNYQTLVAKKVKKLVCPSYLVSDLTAQFHAIEEPKKPILYEFQYTSGTNSPGDFVVFYRPEGFTSLE